jgi:hypothetical protein
MAFQAFLSRPALAETTFNAALALVVNDNQASHALFD